MQGTGILFDVKRFAVHDGPGIRTTLFFKGCPLRCAWCHNPESQRLHPEPVAAAGLRRCARWNAWSAPNTVGREVTVAACMQEVERDVVFYDESGGGVTCSGGEPLMQPRFLHALLEACRARALHTAVDTSGFAPWSQVEPLSRLADLFLYDLKLMDEDAHRHYVQVGNRQILDNLVRLHDAGANVIVRIPLIPGITDTEANLSHLIRFIAPLDNLRAVALLPYNPIGEDKYRRLGVAPRLEPRRTQSAGELAAIKDRFGALDLDVKIGG